MAEVLKKAEAQYPFVGTSLVPVFFPGSMRVRESELQFWREAQQKRWEPNRWGTRIDNLPASDMGEKKEVLDGITLINNLPASDMGEENGVLDTITLIDNLPPADIGEKKELLDGGTRIDNLPASEMGEKKELLDGETL